MRPRTHSENREVLCGVCYRKEKNLRKISPTHLLQLQTLVDKRYSLTDEKYQSFLCKSCLLSLSAHSKTDRGRKLLKPRYDNLTPPPQYNTRNSDDTPCVCTTCQIAAENLTPGRRPVALKEEYWLLLFPDIPFPCVEVRLLI